MGIALLGEECEDSVMGDALGEGKEKAGMVLMSICSGRWRIAPEFGGEVALLEKGLA